MMDEPGDDVHPIPKAVQKSPTVVDVARLAEVAPITVSRVINNKKYVLETTRKRVQDAIDALGYVPDGYAQHLAQKKRKQ